MLGKELVNADGELRWYRCRRTDVVYVDGNSILGAATGQQGVDWMGMAGSAMADGKLDMNDLMRVAGSQMGGGGGLGGMLGGLLGGR